VTDTSAVRLPDRIGIGVLTRLVGRDLVDEVLAETGRVERRRRLLPARVVVYYVMALCLFFGDAYEEVMRKLAGGLQLLRAWDQDWQVPTASALCQARQRLGAAPLRELFDRVAQPMLARGASRGWLGPWRVMAIDCFQLDMPDSTANAEHFGRGSNRFGADPFPQTRIAALTECGTRAVVAAVIGTARVGERELAHDLLDRIDEDMLVLADRGFYSLKLWRQMHSRGAQLLWRVTWPTILSVQQELPDGSYLSVLIPKQVRQDMAHGKNRHVERYAVAVRVIEYKITNRGAGENGEPETIRLITTALDHEIAPAAEMATLYHQRWEIELVFHPIQTHQMGHPRLLRSKSPELVYQEIWALFLTHYAIRHLIFQAADDIDDPDRISFMRALRIVRRQVSDQAAFSPQQTGQSGQQRDH
jgi:hypothetical protein